mmetsp:Transcript_51876/g.133753  ORF Transcript_51876/g.133753 Transcript_51876/m.133753 type:complete len:335 (-) Transcript_51876:1884-2888(-)
MAFAQPSPPEPQVVASFAAPPSSAASPPSVGKSSATALYSSAFFFTGGREADFFASGTSFSAPFSRSVIIFSAAFTLDSTPLISTVPSLRPTVIITPVFSRMFFSVEPPVPMMRGIISSATFISRAIVSAWSLTTCSANLAMSFFACSTPLAPPRIVTVPLCESALRVVLVLVWMSFNLAALLIVSALIVSSLASMVSTVPSFSMTASISFFAAATWASSPMITRLSLLRRTSAPEAFEISAVLSSWKTRCCSRLITTVAGSKSAFLKRSWSLALIEPSSFFGPMSWKPPSRRSMRTAVASRTALKADRIVSLAPLPLSLSVSPSRNSEPIDLR